MTAFASIRFMFSSQLTDENPGPVGVVAVPRSRRQVQVSG
jgi:hypothetical protein